MNTLAQLLHELPGVRAVGAPERADVRRVHTDTRTLRPGDLFVALRGERFDAHDYLAAARAAGAVAALAERGLDSAGLPGVEVPDSRVALGQLAARWRAQFALPLIAVTGSNGKTTVTQMLAAILRAAAGEAALATQGNLNNDIGVPLTVLRLRPEHRLAVVELGMNHPGEIAGLAAVAQPTVALVNNAQREHQEFMATVEAVARENAAVFAALPADGTAVFPADDAYTPLWRELAAGRPVLTFGDGASADVRGSATWAQGAWMALIHTPAGSLEAVLHIAGRHNVRNALAATACALAAGVPLDAIAQGLSTFEPVTGRSRALALQLAGRAITLVDDSYNANPDSVRAAIDVLAELPGPRLLALGDMGEVGDQGLAFHDEVLRHALASGIEHVLVSGDWMAQAVAALPATGGARLEYFNDTPALTARATALAPGLGSVLVKGSRFMRMERVVQALQALPDTTTKEGAHAA
ncbi:UDP-N-acetylmuramoyl-tripeptide--D-alanyl-D-alanine ligase [Macromonas nakdongensis]|uniref:UDP-N-acetylmuramoyl-tripeptide--D-alanyl-D- alanine ligase n=1 Tax=Macromonas nakdongensis TaxID=1843082 RepID=UPI000C34CEEC|nr:UDP-N-acetylmuramoyl-tripeptide--D-alanyl-D-alanine ligase [Macromonas nakdongensis]